MGAAGFQVGLWLSAGSRPQRLKVQVVDDVEVVMTKLITGASFRDAAHRLAAKCSRTSTSWGLVRLHQRPTGPPEEV